MSVKMYSQPALDKRPRTVQSESEKLYLLSLNHGFDRLPHHELERWRPYVRRFQEVRRIPVRSVLRCPDCHSSKWMPLGQKVYYHSLITVRECLECGLYYTDGSIDAAAISLFFEDNYKDETYFWRRRLIFEDLTNLAAAYMPSQGGVLDIGGASGHLLEMIRRVRPQAQLALSDISEKACRIAQQKIPGLSTVACTLADLDTKGEQYDVVIASDVIYYEHEACKTWENLRSCLKSDGTLLLRMPNKSWLIKLVQRLKSRWQPSDRRGLDVEIPFFNSEHVLLMTRSYLDRRLRNMGFRSVEFLPSPALDKRGVAGFFGRVGYAIGCVVHQLTGRVITPGMVVVAHNLSR